jgi:hypothetical protein
MVAKVTKMLDDFGSETLKRAMAISMVKIVYQIEGVR